MNDSDYNQYMGITKLSAATCPCAYHRKKQPIRGTPEYLLAKGLLAASNPSVANGAWLNLLLSVQEYVISSGLDVAKFRQYIVEG